MTSSMHRAEQSRLIVGGISLGKSQFWANNFYDVLQMLNLREIVRVMTQIKQPQRQ